MTAALVPLAVIAVIVSIDVWVYFDARRCATEGAPVEARLGSLVVTTPIAWFAACVVLWIFFFPMYLISRSR